MTSYIIYTSGMTKEKCFNTWEKFPCMLYMVSAVSNTTAYTASVHTTVARFSCMSWEPH